MQMVSNMSRDLLMDSTCPAFNPAPPRPRVTCDPDPARSEGALPAGGGGGGRGCGGEVVCAFVRAR
eukprot:7700015-Pyramimonas_sp.AAC.1